MLFEAACSHDPVLRLAGVNRALEGLAIDVFTTMKEFGDVAGDPVLEFCEDWMLADEVTHVKMGSDWLRRLTENDPARRAAALEFQQVVDKLFSYGGTRSDSRRVGHRPGPPVPRAGRLHRRGDRRDRRPVGRRARRGQGPPAAGHRRSEPLMAVAVSPQEFTFVLFDAGVIAGAIEGLLERVGLGDRDVRIEVDETSPIVRVQVQPGDPIVVQAESGAFEDARRPRELSELAVVTAVGRMLLRLQDREGEGFREAPSDDDLTLAQSAAWDVVSIARLGRLGYEVNRQRWLYNFRNRHGFTDGGDRIFDELWSHGVASWAELAEQSDRAVATRTSA